MGIDAQRVKFEENWNSMAPLAPASNTLEKVAAPDMRRSFSQASGPEMASTPSLQNMPGMAVISNPNNAINLNAKPQLSGYQVENTGESLKGIRMGTTQNDSIFTAALGQVEEAAHAVGSALNPQQAAMDPREFQMSQQFTMRPAAFGLG
jgi:hypothetical protein